MQLFNRRNIATSIVLSFVTFGIYGLYWQYLLVKNTRMVKEDYSSCVGEMLCLIFVPFYSLYWWYTRGELVHKELTKAGYSINGTGIVYLLLSLFGFGIVNMALMQNDFNSTHAFRGSGNYGTATNSENGSNGFSGNNRKGKSNTPYVLLIAISILFIIGGAISIPLMAKSISQYEIVKNDSYNSIHAATAVIQFYDGYGSRPTERDIKDLLANGIYNFKDRTRLMIFREKMKDKIDVIQGKMTTRKVFITINSILSALSLIMLIFSIVMLKKNKKYQPYIS